MGYAPTCDTSACEGSCCYFQRGKFDIVGQQVAVFDTVYLLLAVISIVFWLARMPSARTILLPVYFHFLLFSVLAFVAVVVLHLLPQRGTEEWNSVLSALYGLALTLEWFVQIAVVTFMLEKSHKPHAIRWSLGRAAFFSVVMGGIWIIGVFAMNSNLTSIAVEAILLIFFTAVAIRFAPISRRSRRPKITPWCSYMVVAHTIFIVSYILVDVDPVSEMCSCANVISMAFYYSTYAIMLFSCLVGDSRFWKYQGGAIMAACEQDPLIMGNTNESQEIVAVAESADLAERVRHLNAKQITLEAMVGAGQFGVVHRGVVDGRVVAVKELKVLQAEWKDTVSALMQEASILAGLDHPGIVQLIGVCIAEDGGPSGHPSCMLITEFVAGGSVFDCIQRFRQTGEPDALSRWGVRRAIMRQLAEAVSFLHSKSPPVLHRDIKSPNILLHFDEVDASVRAQLCDFGVSRLRETTATMTSVGTPQWMAPELLRGERYDDKADVWAIGVVLWELATLSRPFENVAPLRVVSMVAYEGVSLPPPPSDTPKSIVRTIRDCLRSKPSDRIRATEAAARLALPDD